MGPNFIKKVIYFLMDVPHIPGGLEIIAGLNTWFRKYGNDYFNLTLLKIITILPIK